MRARVVGRILFLHLTLARLQPAAAAAVPIVPLSGLEARKGRCIRQNEIIYEGIRSCAVHSISAHAA